jgi:hypothetical protein
LFFARLKCYSDANRGGCTLVQLEAKGLLQNWEALKFEEEFKSMYDDLLPMANKEVL